MSGSRSLTRDVDLDIAGLLGSVWRRKWPILAITLIGTALMFMAFVTMEPRYKSEARIIIERQESIFTRIRDNEFLPFTGFDEQTIGSQVQVLTSDDLLLKIIADLKLSAHPDFKQKGPSFIGGLLAIVGGSGPSVQISREQQILEEFRTRLQVYAAENSRVIVVEYWSHDPQLARSVPNALVEEFIRQTREVRSESDAAATDWLGPEIDDLRKKVLDAEAKVAEYRSSSDLLIGDNNALLATQQLSEVSSELSRVRADRSAAEAKVDTIRSALDDGLSLDTIPEVIASPLIQRLRERVSSLEAQISELSTTLLPNHPRVRALQSQLPGFNRQIREAAGDILKSFENNVALARKQETVLVQEINRLKAESARVGEAEVELRALEREAASQRALLESYLTRYREAAGRQNRDYIPVDARIISRATLPASSYFPKVVPFTGAAGVSLLILSIVGVLAVELLSGRAFKPVEPVTDEDVPERVVIANAPSLRPADDDLMIDEAASGIALPMGAPSVPPDLAEAANDPEIFGLSYAIRAIAGLGNAAVAVVSPGGSLGSLLTWELARELSRGGHSTVVADLTGDGVTAREMIGPEGVPGLYDVLAGRSTLRGVLYQDHASQVHVLAPGDADTASVDASRVVQVAEALKDSYDFVVFDCGAAGLAGLSRIADSDTIILITTVGAELSECRTLERQLREAGFDETILVRPGSDAPASSTLSVA